MGKAPSITHLKPKLPAPHDLPTEGRVAHLEAEIGASLPSDYRAFLLQYGGCEVEFEAPILEPSPFGDRYSQREFHSLYHDREASGDIRRYLESQIVPRNMIVIASGDFGQAT